MKGESTDIGQDGNPSYLKMSLNATVIPSPFWNSIPLQTGLERKVKVAAF